jgi:hypothetical protein
MTQPNELRKQKYERFKELFAISRQRYLDAGGDPRRSSGSLHNNSYLTDREQKELFALGRELSGFYVKDGYAHCQGRSWKLPDDSPLLKRDEVKSEV